MGEVPVHEHVGDDLPRSEKMRHGKEQRKTLYHELLVYRRKDEHERIQDDDVLYDYGHTGKKSALFVLVHNG